MGIQRGGSGSGVFLWGKRGFQFLVLAAPLAFVLVKGIGRTAPSDIARERFLLFRRRTAVFLLNCFERIDRVHIGAELGLRPTFTHVGVRNTEVFHRRRRCGRLALRFVNMQRLDLNAIRQSILYSGIKGNRFRMDFLLLLFPQHQALEALMALRAKDRV